MPSGFTPLYHLSNYYIVIDPEYFANVCFLYKMEKYKIVLCLSTRSQKGVSKISPAVKLFLRAYHYVGHSGWSLVTSDVSHEWPVTIRSDPLSDKPEKTVSMRVRFLHSVWLRVERQWTFFNEYLNYFTAMMSFLNGFFNSSQKSMNFS